MTLRARIDFMGLIGVSLANPNGDPLNGGVPRTDSSGYGIMTDVCIKRKLRNRLQQCGVPVLISPPQDRSDSIAARLSELDHLPAEELAGAACSRWYDVRAFGQVFFGQGTKRSRSDSVRGVVSVRHALSADPVEIVPVPVTRCINGVGSGSRGRDTFGYRSIVRYGLYILKGTVCASRAEKNGFTESDAQQLKYALCSMFYDDASASRPEGSMVMERLYWWRHATKFGCCSSEKLFDTVNLRLRSGCERPLRFSDYIVEEQHLNGLTPEIIC